MKDSSATPREKSKPPRNSASGKPASGKKPASRKKKTPQDTQSALVETVKQRLREGKPVRRTVPGGGRLHVDRQLPFICVYRQPVEREDRGTERFVKGEASYLVVPAEQEHSEHARELLRQTISVLSEVFGAFLIVEVWSGKDGSRASDPAIHSVSPKFSIRAPSGVGVTRAVESLSKQLSRIKVLKQTVDVEIDWEGTLHPRDADTILSDDEARELACTTIGLVVPTVYRNDKADKNFPLIERALRRSVSLALRHAFFQFSKSQTKHRPDHFHSLGRRAVVRAVWDVDRMLAEVGSSFDYLLQLTPVNTSGAFKEFERSGFEKTPEFHYRPQPIDPVLLQRKLYNIPLERIEDPALYSLFVEKQDELGNKIMMLRDRDTPRFLYESLQVFGGVSDELLSEAEALLSALGSTRDGTKGPRLDAEAFARVAEEEFDHYRAACSEFVGEAKISDDVNGLIVSKGKLMIDSNLSLPEARARALCAHEIGTHLLTYTNGKQQRFQQLYSGLAGYEELQEGLAVLSEYLVGGLSRSRMRQLAARVVAVRSLTDGGTFVETFRLLDRQYEFSQKQAYSITMRVFRGGGLTKDAVYLRGLIDILRYVRKGGDLEPLFVGKLAVRHISIIKELQYREVLAPAAVRPRYMDDSDALARLARLAEEDTSPVDLVDEESEATR